MGLTERVLANGWILAVFAGVIALRERIEARLGQETVAWSLAMAALFAVGALSRPLWS